MTSDRVSYILLNVTLQSALLCLLARIALRVMRKAAAAYRHLVLVLLINALMVLPLLSWVLPRWRIALPPQGLSSRSPAAGYVASALSDQNTSAGSAAGFSSTDTLAAAAHAAPQARTLQPRFSPALKAERIPLIAGVAVIPRHSYQAPVWRTAAFGRIVLIAWSLGFAISVVRLLAGLIACRRLALREPIAIPAITEMLNQLQTEIGHRCPIVVRQTMAVAEDATPCAPAPPLIMGGIRPIVLLPAAPFTMGWIRPTVLLPAAAASWPRERLRIIALHEFAHVQRADWLFQVLAQFTRALYWFHPFVGWAARRLQSESEHACDDMVLMAGVVPTDYAAALMEVVRTMNRSKASYLLSASTVGMALPPIEGRLRAILAPHTCRKPSRGMVLLASVGTALCVLPLAALHVGAEPVQAASSSGPVVRPASRSPFGVGFIRASVTSMSPGPARPSSTGTGLYGIKDSETPNARLLRRKLDAVKQQLAQKQRENIKLRQQLKALQSQRQTKSTQLVKSTGFQPVQPDRNALLDLKKQQALYADQYIRAEQLYKNSAITIQDLNRIHVDSDINRIKLNALNKQISDLKSGRNITAEEQNRNQVSAQIDVAEARLKADEEMLALTTKRHDAGVATQSDVLAAQRSVLARQEEIDELKLKLSQLMAPPW